MGLLGFMWTGAFLASELGLAWMVRVARRAGERRIEVMVLLSAELVLVGYVSYLTSRAGPFTRVFPGTWSVVPLIVLIIGFVATICWGIFYVGRA